jgi:hypothetical protein
MAEQKKKGPIVKPSKVAGLSEKEQRVYNSLFAEAGEDVTPAEQESLLKKMRASGKASEPEDIPVDVEKELKKIKVPEAPKVPETIEFADDGQEKFGIKKDSLKELPENLGNKKPEPTFRTLDAEASEKASKMVGEKPALRGIKDEAPLAEGVLTNLQKSTAARDASKFGLDKAEDVLAKTTINEIEKSSAPAATKSLLTQMKNAGTKGKIAATVALGTGAAVAGALAWLNKKDEEIAATEPERTPIPEEKEEPSQEASSSTEEVEAKGPKGPALVRVPSEKEFLQGITGIQDRKNALEGVKDKLPLEVQNDFKKELTNIDKAITSAKERYASDKETVNWARAAETIGQALTQLAAGWYGLKTGYDLSGLKFSKADWQSDLDRLLKEYDGEVSLEYKKRQAVESNLERAETSKQREAERERDRLTRGFEKEDEARQEYARARQGAEKFNVEQLNRADAMALRYGQSVTDPKEKKEADRRLKDLMNQRAKDIQQLNSTLVKDVPKIQKPEDKITSLRNLLKGQGVSDDKLKQIEEGSDTFYTTKSERVERLSSHAGELLSKMRGDLTDLQKAYATGSRPSQEGQPAAGEKIRVKRKADGQTGTIDAADFDPDKYEEL